MTAAAAAPAAGAAAAIEHPREWPVYSGAAVREAAALVAAGKSFDYDHGPEVAGFERDFAAAHGRRHALALASGTAGLLAGYHAIGIGPGDEVLVPAYTFFSTATPLLLLGAVPVLCEPGEPNGNVTAAQLAPLIGPRTAAIAVTHLWGHPCDMAPIRALADRRGLALLEDCSHAHGSRRDGRRVGGSGDLAVFSVGGRKLVSGGMGGVLLCDDDDLYARACLVSTFRHRTDLTIPPGAYDAFRTTGLGGNFRMSPIAAVLAGSHLAALDELARRRCANTTALARGLARHDGISTVPAGEGCTTGACYDTVVSVDEGARWSRDELAARLKAAGLRVREPATRPLHRYPLFLGAQPRWHAQMSRAAAEAARVNARPFPRADALFDRWLTLPANFLWDAQGAIVEPYLDAARTALAA